MRRFIYAPQVTAFIRSEEAGKTIDVSKDIISGSVTRRLDAVSNASLVLQNKFGLYTRKFKPMDRIAIFMTRVGDPMLVFSGYLDEAPFYQMFPAPVTIQASCTLKLLQNTYFDPGLPFMTQWFMKFGWNYLPETGQLLDPFRGFGNYDQKTSDKFSDGNLAALISAALHEIVGWPDDHIFIRSIPGEFKKTLHYLMKEEALEYKEDYEHMVATMTALLGIGQQDDVTQSNDLPTFSGGNASGVQIAAFAKAAGFHGDGLVTAVAVALAESSGNTNAMNYNTNATYDVGLWQINTVHTSGGGSGMPAPPGGVGTMSMHDWNSIKGSVPAGPRAFVQNCFNPQFNAAQAYSISNGGHDFSPWSTYPSKSQAHMVEARKAVDAFLHRKGKDITLGKSGVQINADTGTSWVDTGLVEGRSRGGKSVANFIDFCKQALGTPYHWGGTDPFHGGADCSGFVQYMFKHYWGIDPGRSTLTQVNAGRHIDKTNARPGDLWLMEGSPPNHVGIYIGGGKVIHDPHTGDVVKIVSIDQLPTFTEVRRILPEDVVMGNVDTSGGGDGAATTVGGQSVQDITSIARAAAWFELQLPSVDQVTSNALSGRRALANDIPIFEWIQQMCQSGGRRFCSMPNGDFLAFFPDYFNDFNRTPYFIIRPIEIIDLNIQVSDRDLRTHVFATGTSYSPQIDLKDRMLSMIASVQEPAFNMFINVDDQSKKTVKERKGKKKSKKKSTDKLHTWKGATPFLKRYGARPLSIDLPDIRNPVLLWMAAWFEFCKQWSKQFGANASFTFMPELLPGGIVNFDNKITMFVEEVTHDFDLEDGSGFRTTAELTSPAAVNKKDKRFGGMVLAGGNFGVAKALEEDQSIQKDAGPPGYIRPDPIDGRGD